MNKESQTSHRSSEESSSSNFECSKINNWPEAVKSIFNGFFITFFLCFLVFIARECQENKHNRLIQKSLLEDKQFEKKFEICMKTPGCKWKSEHYGGGINISK